ncbi:aldo/keto reductase [Kitasatospora aureofaciens]|uniref:aldo/keto reductase n=1 Tax=Kitasatospora aureofaciens TaxID=1894 RepID=UPI0035A8A861
MNFIDTADEYGDGRSEQIVGSVLRSLARTGAKAPTVATKMGRWLDRAGPLRRTDPSAGPRPVVIRCVGATESKRAARRT